MGLNKADLSQAKKVGIEKRERDPSLQCENVEKTDHRIPLHTEHKMLPLLVHKNKYVFAQLCAHVCPSAGIFVSMEGFKTESRLSPLLWLDDLESTTCTHSIMQLLFKAAASTFAFGHQQQLSDSCQVAAALFWLIRLHTHTSAACVRVCTCVCTRV